MSQQGRPTLELVTTFEVPPSEGSEYTPDAEQPPKTRRKTVHTCSKVDPTQLVRGVNKTLVTLLESKKTDNDPTLKKMLKFHIRQLIVLEAVLREMNGQEDLSNISVLSLTKPVSHDYLMDIMSNLFSDKEIEAYNQLNFRISEQVKVFHHRWSNNERVKGWMNETVASCSKSEILEVPSPRGP